MSESIVSESIVLTDPDATESAGRSLALALLESRPENLCICLEGDLGAGKTTLARGFMRGLGHAGRVPSPTYTLVEPYELQGYRIYHLDLYRLGDGAELEYLGISEMTDPGSVLLIEWPSRAADDIPDSDLSIKLKVISQGRGLSLRATSPTGEELLAAYPVSG